MIDFGSAAIGFVLGAAALLFILYAISHHDRRYEQAARAEAERRGTDPKFYCAYHNEAFHTDRAARIHAISQHNAPTEGGAWKDTYRNASE
jgi:hypothetical protein